MTLRTIKHSLFRYVDAGGVQREAFRNQRVDIPPAEVSRGVALGALVEPDAPPSTPPTAPNDGTAPSATYSVVTKNGVAVTGTAAFTDLTLADLTGLGAVALSELPERVQDIVGAFITAGSGVTVTYDDVAGTFVISSAGGASSLIVQDENGNVSTAVTQIDFQGAGVTVAPGTGEVIVTVPGGGVGTPDAWMGFAATTLASPTAQTGTASRGYWTRVQRGSVAAATKIDVGIAVAAGNICVAVYRNVGSGLAARPGPLASTSGAVPCPAAGLAAVPVLTAVSVDVGDWLYVGYDDATVSLLATGTSTASPLLAAISGYANTAFPAPDVAPVILGWNRQYALFAEA